MTIVLPKSPETGRDLLSPKQIKSIDMSDRFTVSVWVGAVSAGKTIASLFAFLLALVVAPRTGSVVIIGQTIQTIERNVIEPLQNRTLFGPLADLVHHTRGSSVAIIMGRTVELIGASNKLAEGRIRGGTFSLVYVDEVTLLPDTEFFNMLLTRLRVPGAVRPRLIGTTNPASRNHWFNTDYIRRREDHDMVVFHLTMNDNPSLDPAYVERMKRSFTGAFYLRFILGLWTNAEGAIYDMWSDARHRIRWEDMPPIGRILAVGVDHGTTNPTSAIMVGITDETDPRTGRPAPRLVLMDEWRHDSRKADPATGITPPKMTDAEQSKALRAWLNSSHVPDDNPGYGLRPMLIAVDSAANGFREQLRRDRVETIGATEAVLPGISELGSLLNLGRLIVTDRCAGFLAEVTEYIWDAKASDGGEDVPVKKDDHSLDAARYAVRSSRQVWFAYFQAAYGLAA